MLLVLQVVMILLSVVIEEIKMLLRVDSGLRKGGRRSPSLSYAKHRTVYSRPALSHSADLTLTEICGDRALLYAFEHAKVSAMNILQGYPVWLGLHEADFLDWHCREGHLTCAPKKATFQAYQLP